jgi:pyridoxamine 5'-phosphate oxidase
MERLKSISTPHYYRPHHYYNPIELLKAWLSEAKDSEIPEFNAMVLSTTDLSGKPSSRVVLLKELNEEGNLVFFTNYQSQKGREIRMNPQVAAIFFWRELEKQVRVEGIVSKTDQKVSEAYFRSRPLESQLSAIVSPQSEVIKDLGDLKKKADGLFVSGVKIKMPENWGGYAIKPQSIEFWQGGKNRLHDRIRYSKRPNKWLMERLAP